MQIKSHYGCTTGGISVDGIDIDNLDNISHKAAAIKVLDKIKEQIIKDKFDLKNRNIIESLLYYIDPIETKSGSYCEQCFDTPVTDIYEI